MISFKQLISLECGDEMGFTLLDIVDQQARSNKIDAALDTARRIADLTDWSAAMESIAIGQLKAGDQHGAAHTAKLIPHEINRSSVFMHIAFAQARLGQVKRAIATVNHIKVPLRRDAVLLGIALIRARANDIAGALATARNMGSELARTRAYREISQYENAQAAALAGHRDMKMTLRSAPPTSRRVISAPGSRPWDNRRPDPEDDSTGSRHDP
jgi:hypothetical protein